jgi:transitional endoplasmic reticulum ATPase
LQGKKGIEFPKKLSPAMAHITPGFSFAFLQECFVATLLILARQEVDELNETEQSMTGEDDLERYELWRVFKHQANILRKEVEGQRQPSSCRSWAEGDFNAQIQSPQGNEGVCEGQHVGRHTGQNSTIRTGNLPDLETLRVKDEVLPELGYAYRKSRLINTAAFMYQ